MLNISCTEDDNSYETFQFTINMKYEIMRVKEIQEYRKKSLMTSRVGVLYESRDFWI